MIESAPRKLVRVTGNVAVATVDSGPIVGVGNDHDIGLVISRSGNHPRLELACVIRGAQVCVANTGSNLQTTEFVFQKDIEHTGNRIAAINSGGAILQDVDVINHWERNEIDHIDILKDRKSTRLNSSHGYISYAVFCLK